MTEVGEVNRIPSFLDRLAQSQREQRVLALAERIFVRLAANPGTPLVRTTDALEDAARALSAARAFHEAAGEWFSTQRAAAAAEAGVCDDRR